MTPRSKWNSGAATLAASSGHVPESSPRVGAVIVFKKGITKAEAERFLTTLSAYTDNAYYVSGKINVHEFDEAYGGPVWYVP